MSKSHPLDGGRPPPVHRGAVGESEKFFGHRGRAVGEGQKFWKVAGRAVGDVLFRRKHRV